MYQIPFKNIGDVLYRNTKQAPEKNWLVFYSETGERVEYTYSQFYSLVCKTANFLLAEGISTGDRIATIAYNHSDTVIQYFACWMLGAVVVPINTGEDDKRIGYILQNSEVKLAFVREKFIHRIKHILNEAGLPATIVTVSENHNDQHLNFHNSINNQAPDFKNIPEVSLDAEALIVYTSGTTGNPKGVVLTQYNMLVDARAISEWHEMNSQQRMMCVLPIHHVNGTIVTLVTPMYFGGSVVLHQKFQSRTFFEIAAKERVNVVSVVPTLLQFLLHENPDITRYDLSSFRHIICGAGPLTVELALKFEERFSIPIIHGYGLSETTCYSCFLPLNLSPQEHTYWLREFGFPSIGVPIPSNEMAIMDEHGALLTEGVKGEIAIRGDNVMKGYFVNPEANEKAFANGWFHSGDEGFFKTDSKGRQFFFITGRIKELIIRGGVNISPFEIDEALMNMPGVKAGITVGFENDWYGEEVGAYIQTSDGVTLTEHEVIEYCRKFFSFQKCPKVVLFGHDIPVTSTGKYQRNKLKPLFEAWKNVQFTETKKKE